MCIGPSTRARPALSALHGGSAAAACPPRPGAAYLDDDLALNARAVDAIIEARPIATVEELAAVKYVGPSTMQTLWDAAQGEPDWYIELEINGDYDWFHSTCEV